MKIMKRSSAGQDGKQREKNAAAMQRRRTATAFISGIIIASVVFSMSGGIAASAIKKSVEAVYQNIIIELNGAKLELLNANGDTVEPFTVGGTTYIPVRAVSSALGLEVDWDATRNAVILTGKTANESETPATKDTVSTTTQPVVNPTVGDHGSQTTTQPQKTPEELYQERYEAYMAEYNTISADYDTRISDLMREKQQYRDELFKRYVSVGNSYQAGIDADKGASEVYDSKISALQQEKSAALSNLRIKYRL